MLPGSSAWQVGERQKRRRAGSKTPARDEASWILATDAQTTVVIPPLRLLTLSSTVHSIMLAGLLSLKAGGFSLPKNCLKPRARPSRHNRSYRLAGSSILSSGSPASAASLPPFFLAAMTSSVVSSSSSIPKSKHRASNSSVAVFRNRKRCRV